jgi:hypothetical protein
VARRSICAPSAIEVGPSGAIKLLRAYVEMPRGEPLVAIIEDKTQRGETRYAAEQQK